MNVSQNFLLQEYVPPIIYDKWGEKSLWFIDNRLFKLMQFIRERFGKVITINDWHKGGQLKYRGFRPPDIDVGAKLSQHRFGRAVDFNVQDVSPRDVNKEIENNFTLYAKFGLTTIEDGEFTKNWTHIDIRNTNQTNLLIVKP